MSTKDPEKPAADFEEDATRQLPGDLKGPCADSMPTVAGQVEARSPHAFGPGEVLAERFRVVRFIGRGGMGEVYEAFDLELEERVAVKTILPDFAIQEKLVERFKREIQLSRQVTHRNVCRIFDLVRHRPAADNEDGREVLLLTMELLRGETLSRYLRRQGALSLGESLPLIRQMAEALDAAHQAGIVHRDFKSANVMLVERAGGPLVKVTDFGLARNLDPEDSSSLTLTGAGNLVGTPEYMAPEQVRGMEATAAADIYAFGVVIFEMVTGIRPFSGETPLSAATKRLEEAPPSPGSLIPGLPKAWESTILRCLHKDASSRFPTATAAVDALADQHTTSRVTVRPWIVAALAAVVVAAAAFWGVVQREAPGRAVDSLQSRPLTTRTSVAVIGFDNLTARVESAWIATALAEMVHTELEVGDDLRTVSQDAVAELRIGMSDRGSAKKVGEGALVADFSVSGAYTALGQAQDFNLRVDISIQDLSSQVAVATFAETGSVDELFDLVERIGKRLRAELGAGRLNANQVATARQAFPSDVVAARLYSEGLERLRAFDALGARDRLAAALEIAPEHAPAHAALSSAWLALGHDREAGEAAARAMELAGGLAKAQRLEIEALARATSWDREGEVEIRRTLFTFYPDDPELGLSLARAQVLVGRGEQALETVSALRTISDRVARNPRVDLAEAEARNSLGELQPVVDIAGRVVPAADRLAAPLLGARALLVMGRAQGRLGETEKGESSLLEAADRYRRAGDIRGVGEAYNVLGALVLAAGRPDEAPQLFNQAIENYRMVGDRRGEAHAIGNLGVVFRRSGQAEKAKQAFEASAHSCQQIGDLDCVGKARENLGILAWHQGQGGDARRHFESALEVFTGIGERSEVAQLLSNLAVLSAAEGDFEEAEQRYEEALQTFRALGDPKRTSMVLNNLATVLRDRDNPKEARRHWQEALQLKEAADDLRGASIVRLNLGQLAITEGNPHAGRELFDEANEVLRNASDQALLAEGLFVTCGVNIVRADFENAKGNIQELEELCAATGGQACSYRVDFYSTLVRLEQGDFAGQTEVLRRIVEGLDDSSELETEILARLVLVRVLTRENRIAEADAESEWAQAAADSSSNRHLQRRVAIAKAHVRIADGDYARAEEILKDVMRQAAAGDDVSSGLEARLGLAVAALHSGETTTALSSIGDLAEEAERRGFLSLAGRARAHLDAS